LLPDKTNRDVEIVRTVQSLARPNYFITQNNVAYDDKPLTFVGRMYDWWRQPWWLSKARADIHNREIDPLDLSTRPHWRPVTHCQKKKKKPQTAMPQRSRLPGVATTSSY
jgi:hypothetical protein